jgi:hypothetical protein
MWQFKIQDNGIGFDEKYREKIFEVFQRLHSRSEYEGSGIGLSLCRKIAMRHGGSIAADSSPGNGATFLITLPERHSDLTSQGKSETTSLSKNGKTPAGNGKPNLTAAHTETSSTGSDPAAAQSKGPLVDAVK